MAIRFLLIWLVILLSVFAWQWVADRKQKKATKKYLYRAAISGFIAACFLTVAMIFLNNISGV